MCLGCREMKPKGDLIRLTKSPQGQISLDDTGKKPGRGAYVCNDPGCFKRVVKSKALSRAFGAAIPEDILTGLQEQIENRETD